MENNQEQIEKKIQQLKNLKNQLKYWNYYWGFVLIATAICTVAKVPALSLNLLIILMVTGLIKQNFISSATIDVMDYLFRESKETV